MNKYFFSSIKNVSLVIFLSLFLCLPAFAQESLALSVTPPLFKLSLSPGETWNSNLRILNTNTYDITVYATPVDVDTADEQGNPSFKPIPDGVLQNTHSLGSWIEIQQGAIHISRDGTANIPLRITVPKDAEPGGHYAAVQVGTLPPKPEGFSGVGVGSEVTSLFVLRVAGAIVEKGQIRDFAAAPEFVSAPHTRMELRFENNGNVHLQPQGNIVITNMWGKERGNIPINKEGSFGNVLPHTTRLFSFEWNGEENFFDVGRYKAVASISYGDEAKQTAYRETYFWVIPWKSIATIVCTFLFLGGALVFLIKSYIRRIVRSERALYGIPDNAPVKKIPSTTSAPLVRTTTIPRNVQQGFFARYRKSFIILVLILVCGFGTYLYFSNVLSDSRGYSVIETKGDQKKTVIDYRNP